MRQAAERHGFGRRRGKREKRFSGVRVQVLGGFELNEKKIKNIFLARDLFWWIFGMLQLLIPAGADPGGRGAGAELGMPISSADAGIHGF